MGLVAGKNFTFSTERFALVSDGMVFAVHVRHVRHAKEAEESRREPALPRRRGEATVPTVRDETQPIGWT